MKKISCVMMVDYYHKYIKTSLSINSIYNHIYLLGTSKYKSFEKLFKQGTPYVQVIPFKRDSWKHEISTYVRSKSQKGYLEYFTTTINRYRDAVWKKKSWK